MERIEKETTINFNEAESTATIYTHNVALRHKLEKLAAERPADCKLQKKYSDNVVEYIVPKRWVKVNAGALLTEEQRKKRSERMAAARRAQIDAATQ